MLPFAPNARPICAKKPRWWWRSRNSKPTHASRTSAWLPTRIVVQHARSKPAFTRRTKLPNCLPKAARTAAAAVAFTSRCWTKFIPKNLGILSAGILSGRSDPTFKKLTRYFRVSFAFVSLDLGVFQAHSHCFSYPSEDFTNCNRASATRSGASIIGMWPASSINTSQERPSRVAIT